MTISSEMQLKIKNTNQLIQTKHTHTIQRTLKTVVPILYLGVGRGPVVGSGSIGDGNTAVFFFVFVFPVIVLFNRTIFVDVISARDFALFFCFFLWTCVTMDGGGSGFWVQPLEGKLGGGGGAVNVSSSPPDVDIIAGVVDTKRLDICSLTTIPSFLECVIRFGSFPFVVEVTADVAVAVAVAVAASAAVILFFSSIIIGSAAVAAGSGATSYKIAPFVLLLVLRLSSIRIRVVVVSLSISG
jgi:hypothetical protein